MKKCSNIPHIPIPPPWTGCDGKILSDDLIAAQMRAAVQDERYEYAAECRNELMRRKRDDIEKVVAALFSDTYADYEKKKALAEAERRGWLAEMLLRHHPEYVFPDGEVKSFTILKVLGWM